MDLPASKPLLFTPAELATELRLSPRKIRAMKSTGELPPAVRFGRAVRWRRQDIAAWLERRLHENN